MSDFFEQLDTELGSIPKNSGSGTPPKPVPKAPISHTPHPMPQKMTQKPINTHPVSSPKKPFFNKPTSSTTPIHPKKE